MGSKENTALKNQLDSLISGKTKEINTCNAIKDRLNIERGNLENYKRKWILQYKKHCASQIASKVVIKNVFEGEIADKLQKTYGDQVDNMQESKEKMDILCGKLDSQIQKLDSHILKLQGEISSAKTKINIMD